MHFLSIYLHTTYVYASKDRHFWEKTLHTQIKTAKLLQKSEMRKDIVIELSYKGFG